DRTRAHLEPTREAAWITAQTILCTLLVSRLPSVCDRNGHCCPLGPHATRSQREDYAGIRGDTWQRVHVKLSFVCIHHTPTAIFLFDWGEHAIRRCVRLDLCPIELLYLPLSHRRLRHNEHGDVVQVVLGCRKQR